MATTSLRMRGRSEIEERSGPRKLIQLLLLTVRRFAVPAAVVLPLVLAPYASDAKNPEDLHWIRLRADDIIVYSSAAEEKTRTVVEGLLRFRDDCLAFLPVDPFIPSVPTYVYLLSDDRAYETLRSPGGESGGSAGVFFQAVDANYIAVDLTAGTLGLAIVYHEYFHFIARHTMPTIPLWANEGLAEFFSTYEFEQDHGVIGHPIKRHTDTLWSEDLMPFADVFAVDHRSDDYRGGHRRGLFYAQSWAIVHSQLTDTPVEREGFQRYLAALAQGMSAQEAMIETLELDEELVLDRLRRRQNDLELPVLAPEQRLADSVALKTDEPDAAEILSALGMFMAREPRTTSAVARRYFQEALRLNPDRFMAYLGLALIDRDNAGDQSRASFVRARELALDEPMVLDAYGEFLLDQYDLKRSGRADNPAPDLELARELFLASLSANPEGPRALAGYALSYRYEAEIPDSVIDALDQAIARYPDRVQLLMVECVYTARRGMHEEAWAKARGRLLEMRPGREVMQSVAIALVNEALTDAYNTAQSGKIEEGRLILEFALQQHRSEKVSKEAWEQFAEAEAHGRHNRSIDRYNEGITAINERDFTRALELLEEVAAAAPDSTLRAAAAKACAQIRPQVK